jgi:hypothetical protein
VNRAFGVRRMMRLLGRSRSSVYWSRALVRDGLQPQKRGPKTAYTDAELLSHIREVLDASAFHGEGHRKVWARLRLKGIRTSKQRTLRLMREANLLAPCQPRRVLGPRVHDGSIIPAMPNMMWGTDGTGVWTERDGPMGLPGKWRGTLITDGYSGFNDVVERNDIVRAGCWAHARRNFKQALDIGARSAVHVLAPIQRLFAIERALVNRAKARELGRDAFVELRARVRQRWSKRLVALIIERADELSRLRSTLPKSPLGKATTYVLRQQQPLSAFLDDARIPIHNNDEERDLRHLKLGTKNWQILGSERGGEVACRLYSLMLSCKQAGVDPQAYIEDVLGRLSTTKAADVAQLTPCAWAATRT